MHLFFPEMPMLTIYVSSFALSLGYIPSSSSLSFPPSSSLEYHRRIVWHMQSWSWSDRGQSPQPPPAPTPIPPAQTLCTLRSSSRKNSCKHSRSGHMAVMVPPLWGWLNWVATKGLYLWTISMAFSICFFGCKYATTVGKWGFLCFLGAVPFQHSSFSGVFIILLFCLLAPLACEPDVYRTLLLLTILYKLRRPCGNKTVVQALLLQHHKGTVTLFKCIYNYSTNTPN